MSLFVSVNFQGKSLILFVLFSLGMFMREKSICYNTGLDNDTQKHLLALMLQNFTGYIFLCIYLFNVTKLRKKRHLCNVYGYFENVTSIVMFVFTLTQEIQITT